VIRTAAALLTLALTVPALAQEPADLAGHWEGRLHTPGAGLVVKLDLTHDADGWSGTIDIPAQGAKGLPLGHFEQDGANLRFQILEVPGEPTFTGELTDGKLAGVFTQAGATLTFELGRDPIEPPKRPQEPKPPFPYRVEEVRYGHGEISLAATLTVPEGEGPFPAVLLITGSGPQDRDESLLGHKPFWVIADHLTRAGVAVLRADDRGVGGSKGPAVSQSTSSDFADDALAGVAFLAEHPAIAADRIGVLGHSEGGLVGPLAATRSESIAFVVMLAGPGVPGHEILERQLAAISLANGRDAAFVERQRAAHHQALQRIMAEAPEAGIREALRALVLVQIEGLPNADQAPVDKMTDQALGQFTPWMRHFMQHDPRGPLRALKVPVLVLQGELDLQVLPDQNVPEIEAALEASSSPDVTVRRFEGLNHLFQHATTGAPAEYAQIEETVSPEVLDTIRDWILERTAR
jgi:pimeloyl-ACP methyl ester carboxylesterase